MATRSLRKKLLTGCLVLGLHSTQALAAPPSPAQVLGFKPRIEGVVVSTPNPQDLPNCKVELISGGKPGSNGWLLRDPKGLPLRRFFDSNGDKKVDIWSYYLDGYEVYREIDSNFNDKPDQYRWFNQGGSRWGVDVNEDGRIDSWKMISPDEVSQEILQAILTKNFARLQALVLTEAELKALELSPAETSRIQKNLASLAAKFQETCSKLSGLQPSQVEWVRFDADVPHCVPADQVGAKQDLVRFPHGTILYKAGDKHDFLQTGEMLYLAGAWRVVEAPYPGDYHRDPKLSDEVTALDPELKKLLDQLRELDARAPRGQETPGPCQPIVQYNLARAEIVNKIVARTHGEDKHNWIRQVAECYSAAAQASTPSDKLAYDKLVQLAQQTARDQPGSAVAAYVAFREMSADYAIRLTEGKDFASIQAKWLERLAQFVQTYPKSEDTPDALLQLGMVSEFVNKEIEAKNWYERLVRDFPDHPLAAKARGAKTRLELEGKPFALSGPTTTGGTFDIQRLAGKIVVVYYWASWNQQCIGDFARLKVLLANYASKGVELVCVNLDNGPPEADGILKTVQVPGTQLYQPGGLESPLATQYGIMALPNMFLIGRDGKVVSRTVQIGTLEDEIKKLLK